MSVTCLFAEIIETLMEFRFGFFVIPHILWYGVEIILPGNNQLLVIENLDININKPMTKKTEQHLNMRHKSHNIVYDDSGDNKKKINNIRHINSNTKNRSKTTNNANDEKKIIKTCL